MPVTQFEVRSRQPFDDGRTFGDAGPYERIDGVLHYAVDPGHASNLGIVDLARAARDEHGRVRFQGDLTLLQSIDPARASGSLLCDAVNRGGRRFTRYNLAATDPLHPERIPAGDGHLMERGWTIASIGWQWDVERSGGLLGLTAPSALAPDGHPIQGWVCVTHQPDTLVPDFMLSDRGHQPYTIADIHQSDARLTVRDFPNGTRQDVPRDQWRFTDRTHVALDGGFEAGRYYEAIYRTDICPVVGAGLLAFRDAASFLRHATTEDNPARGRISHAFGMGVSQSGRFLREFLAAGANLDEDGRAVYDGLHVHVAGGCRGDFNHRYAQPSAGAGSGAGYGLGHLPPFAYEDTRDPRDDTPIPGLLTKARAQHAAPRIVATNSAFEYWRGDASMAHIDPDAGQDLPPPPEVRTYLFAGTQHGSGTLPLRYGSLGGVPVSTVNPLNIVDYMPLLRAALANLERWVRDGVELPPSALPRLSDRTAVTRDRASYSLSMLPNITMVQVRRLWSLPKFDFGPEAAAGIGSYPPVVKLTEQFPTFVSAVDADGNEIAGIRLPDISVPLATHTGWNPRHSDTGGLDETAGINGSTIPFARSVAEREANDPRPSIEERYRDRADYLTRVRAATEVLAAQRYLLADDIGLVVENTMARWDALVPGASS
ncbi:MAG: hypothetical protein EXR68_07840 [Dehalococcoidia bacterium]|nr:hypothetical protein [Dehalococcoidia bacterium]